MKMRQTLHRIGFSDELIDGNDVGYVAVKVLQVLKECVDAKQCSSNSGSSKSRDS